MAKPQQYQLPCDPPNSQSGWPFAWQDSHPGRKSRIAKTHFVGRDHFNRLPGHGKLLALGSYN